MSKPLRAAVIGCGLLGRIHSESVAQLEGMTMVAFCDVIAERAQALCHDFTGEYATTDPVRIFADPSLDAVYICTQHDSHAALCLQGCAAGKHLLVEKPLATTLEECRAIAAAVERSGIKLMSAFKMRYYDMILKAKELIPRPLMVTMQMMDERWGDTIWPNDPIKGGGNVLSQGCHSCDILRFVADADPIEVYAAGGNYYTATGVIDNLTAVFRFENGIAGNWVQGDCDCPPHTSKFYLQLFAEGKSVTLHNRLTTLTYHENGKPPQVFQGSESGMLEENRAFITCLREDSRPPIDHRDGLLATLMPLQAGRSLRSGRPEPIAAVVNKAVGIMEQ